MQNRAGLSIISIGIGISSIMSTCIYLRTNTPIFNQIFTLYYKQVVMASRRSRRCCSFYKYITSLSLGVYI
jgi:hypothetical protein